MLRGKQLCGLKFGRQHPIGPFFADFACVSHRLVIEIDGGYHDSVPDRDLSRQAAIESEGWRVIRFSDQDAQQVPESVAIGISDYLGLNDEYRKRLGTGSGMENITAPNKRLSTSPPRPLARPTLPEGGFPRAKPDTVPSGGPNTQAAGASE